MSRSEWSRRYRETHPEYRERERERKKKRNWAASGGTKSSDSRGRQDSKAYHQSYYQANFGKIREDRMIVYRTKREYVRKMKEKPCADCGVQHPYMCMDFDHVRGEKSFNIAQRLSYPLKLIKAEIEKCDVVCSNCHRKRTAARSDQAWERRAISKAHAYRARPQPTVAQLDLGI